MDFIDDDFGELYADVEVHVKPTLLNSPHITTLHTEPEPEDNSNSNFNNPGSEKDSVTESTQKGWTFGDGDDDDESDSEHELKIVLNDEDCNKFPVVDEDEDEYIRSHNSTFPNNLRVDGSARMASSLSMSAKGDCEDNGYNLHKGSNTGQFAGIGLMANMVIPQCAYGFSLPLYRTILDVNIDSFGKKQWSHPGANISDFFNFGFNEDSWKRYCSSLDQFRNRTFFKAYEVGSEHGKVVRESRTEDITHVRSSSKFSVGGERPLELPKGRAIEVEGSIGERQPSMDVRHPRIQDSDVVIQINVQDSAEDYSGCGKEKLGLRDGNSSDHETSKNGYLGQDFNRDVHFCGSSSEDEPFADSLEKDTRNLDPVYALRRCTEPMSVSNQMSLDSDGHGKGKVHNGDRYNHQEVNICISEEKSEAMETFSNADKMVGCNSDLSLMETELSLGDRIHLSLSPTCSGSDFEASKDGVRGDPVRICSPSTPNSGTALQDSVRSDHKNSINNGIKQERGDRKYFLRQRSPKREDRKHHSGRHCGVKEQRICPESEDDASLISNGKYDGRSYLRCGPVRQRRKRCHGEFYSTSEQEIHPENSDDVSLMSDAEGIYCRDYRSVYCGRQKERLHDLGYLERENFSYYRETGSSSGYSSERFGDSHIWADCKGHFRWKSRQCFRDQIYSRVRRKWDERECFHEISGRADNEDEVDSSHHHCKRGCSLKEMTSLACEDSSRLVRNYPLTLKTKRRSKSDKLRSWKRIDLGGGFLDNSKEDDFMQEKYGRSVSFFDRERDALNNLYMRDLQFTGKEAKLSVQMERYCNSSHFLLDRSWFREIRSGYKRHTNHQSSIPQSYRECYTANEERWHDTRSSIDEVSPKGYGKRRRHIYDRDNGWLGIYDNIDDTNDSFVDNYDPVDFGRRTHIWQSEEVHRFEDEFIARDWENDLFSDKASFSYSQTSMCESIRAKYESDREWMHIGDTQLKCSRHKLTGEGSSTKRVNRNYNCRYRGEHDHPALRCRDSLDLILGEGKPYGRQSNGRSLILNGRFGKIDLKLAKERTSSKGVYESGRARAFRSDDILSVTKHKEDLDIEEGQIILDEPNTENLLEKKHVSERIATCNVKKRISRCGNASNEKKIVGQIDHQRILETLAKMEKRRERFKDFIAPNQGLDKDPKPQADLMVSIAETKQQRPARKRRWGGSLSSHGTVPYSLKA